MRSKDGQHATLNQRIITGTSLLPLHSHLRFPFSPSLVFLALSSWSNPRGITDTVGFLDSCHVVYWVTFHLYANLSLSKSTKYLSIPIWGQEFLSSAYLNYLLHIIIVTLKFTLKWADFQEFLPILDSTLAISGDSDTQYPILPIHLHMTLAGTPTYNSLWGGGEYEQRSERKG
ncbi:hypothetical protein Btru_014113 [Bulinus truncatus]|nr:hypothetical protein Btru_014113 [Bulinus truncatus]